METQIIPGFVRTRWPCGKYAWIRRGRLWLSRLDYRQAAASALSEYRRAIRYVRAGLANVRFRFRANVRHNVARMLVQRRYGSDHPRVRHVLEPVAVLFRGVITQLHMLFQHLRFGALRPSASRIQQRRESLLHFLSCFADPAFERAGQRAAEALQKLSCSRSLRAISARLPGSAQRKRPPVSRTASAARCPARSKAGSAKHERKCRRDSRRCWNPGSRWPKRTKRRC